MNSSDCANAWRKVCQIYDETREINRPKITSERIVEELGLEAALETFATIAKIKERDGRISNRNREYLRVITVYRGSIERDHSNPLFDTGLLDHIHTSHIDNLITELIRMRGEKDV